MSAVRYPPGPGERVVLARDLKPGDEILRDAALYPPLLYAGEVTEVEQLPLVGRVVVDQGNGWRFSRSLDHPFVVRGETP